MSKKSEQRITEEKEIQYYSAIVNSWITTLFERDKGLLSLSAGGIAIVVTLITTIGYGNLVTLILSYVAIILFIISLVSVLIIFRRNADYLENVINDNQKEDECLKMLDKITITTFITGIIFASAAGITISINKYMETAMPKKNTNINKTSKQDSLNKISSMQPLQKSLNGITATQAPKKINSSTSQSQTNTDNKKK